MRNKWARSPHPKRLFDLILSALALPLLSPLLGLLALLVRLKLGSPVLFRQQRPGMGGEPFTLIKFRTMTDQRDAQGNLLPDAQRLTKINQFLCDTIRKGGTMQLPVVPQPPIRWAVQ